MNDDFDESKLFSAHALQTPSILNDYYVYRLPGVNVDIPTKGKYLSNPETTINGEFIVSPMRAQDDMLLKNPDALMSGHALEKLFESCVPGLGNPREVSLPDIEVLLVAIRAATYGNKMLLDVKCPECEAEYDYAIDLPNLLGSMTYVNEDEVVACGQQVSVYVRPYNLHNATMIALRAFEESRILQTLNNNTTDDEDGRKLIMDKMGESLSRLKEAENIVLADCISKIVVPTGTAENKDEILSFLTNIPKPWKESIEKRVTDMNSHGIDKSIHIKCEKCKHEWDSQMEIDPTNFFDAGS